MAGKRVRREAGVTLEELPDWLFGIGDAWPRDWLERGERPHDFDHGAVVKAWLQQNAAALVQDRQLPAGWHDERKARRKRAALEWDREWAEDWILPPGVDDLPQADPGDWPNLPAKLVPPVVPSRILAPDLSGLERDALVAFYQATGQAPPRRARAKR